MTGLFLFPTSILGKAKHLHIILTLEHSKVSHLYYWNARRFGRVYLLDPEELGRFLDRRFGLDPFAMTPMTFGDILGQSRGRVKAILLNQHKIAGIGNIYANEILYRAGVHPHAKGNRLSKAALNRLFHSTQTVLREAITKGGSTIQDFCAPDGTRGGYQMYHAVYQKGGEPCPRGCPAIIRRSVKERSSFFLSFVSKAPLKIPLASPKLMKQRPQLLPCIHFAFSYSQFSEKYFESFLPLPMGFFHGFKHFLSVYTTFARIDYLEEIMKNTIKST